MRSSLVRAARAAPPVPRDSRTASISGLGRSYQPTYPQQQPLASPRLGGDRARVIKFNIRRARHPLVLIVSPHRSLALAFSVVSTSALPAFRVPPRVQIGSARGSAKTLRSHNEHIEHCESSGARPFRSARRVPSHLVNRDSH